MGNLLQIVGIKLGKTSLNLRSSPKNCRKNYRRSKIPKIFRRHNHYFLSVLGRVGEGRVPTDVATAPLFTAMLSENAKYLMTRSFSGILTSIQRSWGIRGYRVPTDLISHLRTQWGFGRLGIPAELLLM